MVVRTGEWISEAWELIKQDFWMHALAALIFSAASSTGIGTFVIGPLLCGYYFIILQKLRNPGEPLNLNGIGEGLNYFLDAFVASLLIGLFFAIGFFLCFIPGLVVMGLLFFTYPLIIDRDMGFWEAISESYRVASQNWLGFTIFVLVLGLISAGLSLFTLGLGYFVAFPLSEVARALAYRDNFGLKGGHVARPAPPPPPPPA